MITKEENALLQLIRSMSAPKQEINNRKQTRQEHRQEARKDLAFYKAKKNLC